MKYLILKGNPLGKTQFTDEVYNAFQDGDKATVYAFDSEKERDEAFTKMIAEQNIQNAAKSGQLSIKNWYESPIIIKWLYVGLHTADKNNGMTESQAISAIDDCLSNIIFFNDGLDNEISTLTKETMKKAYNHLTEKEKKVIDKLVDESIVLGLKTFEPTTGTSRNVGG